MTLDMSLNSKDIAGVIGQLKRVQSDLPRQCNLFVSRLIDVGIEVAKKHTGRYGEYIVFSKALNESEYGCSGLMIATNGEKPKVKWYTNKKLSKEREYEVNPLLLAEFGSGWLAEVMFDVPGVGQGTMPNSYGHATDDDGWYWYDEDASKHHSIGETPTMPMYNALIGMMREIESIAREVFKLG